MRRPAAAASSSESSPARGAGTEEKRTTSVSWSRGSSHVDGRPIEEGERGTVLRVRDAHEAGRGEVGVVREGVGGLAGAPLLVLREDDVPSPGPGRLDPERDLPSAGQLGLAAAEARLRRLPLEVEAVHRPRGAPARLVRDRRASVPVEDELDLDPLHRALREGRATVGRRSGSRRAGEGQPRRARKVGRRGAMNPPVDDDPRDSTVSFRGTPVGPVPRNPPAPATADPSSHDDPRDRCSSG